MWRMWFVLLVAVVSCGHDGPFDMAWGGTCSSGRVAVMAIDHDGRGPATPELALERLLDTARPEGISGPLPADALSKDGWERADFVPRPERTIPVLPIAGGAEASTEIAFVHRDGDRIDAAIAFQYANGWVVEGVHRCAD